jgi:GTPase SAR1 family protein
VAFPVQRQATSNPVRCLADLLLLVLQFGKKEMRILMVGLDAAGKTTILYKLKLGEGEFQKSFNCCIGDWSFVFDS